MRKLLLLAVSSVFIGMTSLNVMADAAADAVAEMARKAQDPLGDVKAIMTDNTIGFGGGPEDDTAYGFQIQPVYAYKENKPLIR